MLKKLVLSTYVEHVRRIVGLLLSSKFVAKLSFQDLVLYASLFHPVGVSLLQFRTLLAMKVLEWVELGPNTTWSPYLCWLSSDPMRYSHSLPLCSLNRGRPLRSSILHRTGWMFVVCSSWCLSQKLLVRLMNLLPVGETWVDESQYW
jgi:hypothetical protein